MIAARYASLIAFAQARAFCATGAGGGIDNSCGGGSVSAAARGGDFKKTVKAVKDSLATKSPSSVLKGLGFAGIKNAAEIDKFYASGSSSDRVGVESWLARMAHAAALDPSVPKTSMHLSSRESAAKAINSALPSDSNFSYSAKELDDAVAFYDPVSDAIYLLIPTTDQDRLEELKRVGYVSSDDPSHSLLHEQAHKEHWDSLNEMYGKPTSSKGFYEMQDRVDDLARSFLKNKSTARGMDKKISSQISRYATTDAMEFVAEYASGVKTGSVRRDSQFDDFAKALGAKPPRKMVA
jgi:hypothetical protein